MLLKYLFFSKSIFFLFSLLFYLFLFYVLRKYGNNICKTEIRSFLKLTPGLTINKMKNCQAMCRRRRWRLYSNNNSSSNNNNNTTFQYLTFPIREVRTFCLTCRRKVANSRPQSRKKKAQKVSTTVGLRRRLPPQTDGPPPKRLPRPNSSRNSCCRQTAAAPRSSSCLHRLSVTPRRCQTL